MSKPGGGKAAENGGWGERLRGRARRLKEETYALYLAARCPETPWPAKLLVAVIVASAASPIDLVPDFIPVLGYLDDLLLIPLGIAAAIRMVPPAVMAQCRDRARAAALQKPPGSGRAAASAIVLMWLLTLALCLPWLYRTVNGTGAAP